MATLHFYDGSLVDVKANADTMMEIIDASNDKFDGWFIVEPAGGRKKYVNAKFIIQVIED